MSFACAAEAEALKHHSLFTRWLLMHELTPTSTSENKPTHVFAGCGRQSELNNAVRRLKCTELVSEVWVLH